MDEKDKLKPEDELIEVSEEETAKTETHKKKDKKKPTIEDQLEIIEAELKEIKDKYLRTLAEMENLQKRTSEEVKRERKYAGMNLADKLIDQLEIFDQALNVKTEDQNFKNFLTGFRMIKDMIYQSLETEGVKLIETKPGDAFNPNLEHAIDTKYDPEQPLNTILEIVKKGYMYKDRLLRPALVVINIKPAEAKTEAKSENKETIDANVA